MSMPGTKRNAASVCWGVLSLVVVACESGHAPQVASTATPAPPPTSVPPPSPLDNRHGHFSEWSHFVEGVLTVDGEVRMHMGGPGLAESVLSGAGTPLNAVPAEQMQFVGRIAWQGNTGNGSGVVIGQSCVRPATGRWCGAAMPAEITLSHPRADLEGEIRVEMGGGTESWRIHLTAWSFAYRALSAHGGAGGIVHEEFAPFARAEPAVINFDSGWRMFFQSASSGCTGNGVSPPHGDGRFYVFDVTLTIENCNAAYADFNGQYEGLATATQSGAWDYDHWFVMLLSTPPGASRAALMMMSSSR
jgi:hypothetical protein